MKAKTKAKIQVRIGLITVLVSMAGTIILFAIPAIVHLISFGELHFRKILLSFGLILPSAYGLALIRKKPKLIFIISLIWSVGWAIPYLLAYLPYYTAVPENSIFFLRSFLGAIFWLPTCAFLLPLVDFFAFYEYTNIESAINGVVFIALLWIGVRGLKQMKQADNKLNGETIQTGNR